jgi:hypothetical protein
MLCFLSSSSLPRPSCTQASRPYSVTSNANVCTPFSSTQHYLVSLLLGVNSRFGCAPKVPKDVAIAELEISLAVIKNGSCSLSICGSCFFTPVREWEWE